MLVRTHNDLDRQGQSQGQGHVTYLGQSRGLRPLIILTGQGQVKVKVKVKGRQVHFFDISTPKSRSEGKKYIFVISRTVLERKLHVYERLLFGPLSRATGWEFNVLGLNIELM